MFETLGSKDNRILTFNEYLKLYPSVIDRSEIWPASIEDNEHRTIYNDNGKKVEDFNKCFRYKRGTGEYFKIISYFVIIPVCAAILLAFIDSETHWKGIKLTLFIYSFVNYFIKIALYFYAMIFFGKLPFMFYHSKSDEYLNIKKNEYLKDYLLYFTKRWCPEDIKHINDVLSFQYQELLNRRNLLFKALNYSLIEKIVKFTYFSLFYVILFIFLYYIRPPMIDDNDFHIFLLGKF